MYQVGYSEAEAHAMDYAPDPGSLENLELNSEHDLPPTEPHAPNVDGQSERLDPREAISNIQSQEQAVDPEIQSEVEATLEDLINAQKFIEAIRAASLDNDKIPDAVVERLRSAPTGAVSLDEDEELRTAIELFLDTGTASEEVFNKVRQTFHRSMDRKGVEYEPLPSLFQVKERIKDITGVYPIKEDMCPNSCMAYTGPFADLEYCPICPERLPRYNPQILAASGGTKRVPQKQFLTLPVGPQLQALWRTPEGSKEMRYRSKLTREMLEKANTRADKKIVIDEYQDIFHGEAYLNAVKEGKIKEDDMVLMMSIDGAQLYQSKHSDCWIYIWVILDLSPDLRYKKRHIIPGGIIPGPNKPKNVDSFLFPGFHHISALAKEGLSIWDASQNRTFKSYIFVLLGLADAPGLTYLNGLTGHSGARGCRLYCPTPGRRKDGGNHYYPAHLKPHNYSVEGSNHNDVNIRFLPIGNPGEYQKAVDRVLQSRTKADHQYNRRITGVARPSIFSGLPSNHVLPVPLCFGGDLMHLVALNIPDLLISLWRGQMECDRNDNKETWDWVVLIGETWKEHGQRVADATPYLPGSFDRPPRNPAEKISSGYKAWEFLTYLYGLGPAY